jgi:hypothetical protein
LDYTIDVLNSDVGLITASRTTEKKKADVSSDTIEPGPSTQNNMDSEIDAEETAKQEQAQTCAKIFGFAVVVVFVLVIINAIFGDRDGDVDDDDDDNDNSGSSKGCFNSSVFADVKYNPFNNSWEQTSPSSELKYNNFDNSWNYEAPESTIQYNSFENSWDYCCYE